MDLYGDLLPTGKSWSSAAQSLKPRSRRPLPVPAATVVSSKPTSTFESAASGLAPQAKQPRIVGRESVQALNADLIVCEPTSGGASAIHQTGLPATIALVGTAASDAAAPSSTIAVGFDPLLLVDEYDPFRPNDYGVILADRERRVEAERRREREEEAAAEAAAEAVKYELLAAAGAFGGRPPPFAATQQQTLAVGREENRPSSFAAAVEASVSRSSAAAASSARGVDNRPAWMIAAGGGAADASASAAGSASGAAPSSSPVAVEMIPNLTSAHPSAAVALDTNAPVATGQYGPPPPSSVTARGVDNRPAWMKTGEGSTGGSSIAPSTVGATSSGVPTSRGPGPSWTPAPSPSSSPSSSSSSSVPLDMSSKIARMMSKWGYKQGQGLGRDGSGIVAPLVHEKTGARSGVIRMAEPIAAPAHSFGATVGPYGHPSLQVGEGIGGGTSSAASGATWAAGSGSLSTGSVPPGSSRIVLLRNMVGPGEADDELEGEVAEEAGRYGPVENVFIFECSAVVLQGEGGSGGGRTVAVPPEEAVRVFIAMCDAEGASKAVTGFHGRFFGGRMVQGCLYEEERFGRFDLAPSPDDVAAAWRGQGQGLHGVGGGNGGR